MLYSACLALFRIFYCYSILLASIWLSGHLADFTREWETKTQYFKSLKDAKERSDHRAVEGPDRH